MRGGSNIWLVGMMGAGKSAVGAELARRLGRSFLDTDAEIERRGGRSIAEIFERDGEAAFRKLEREAVDAVSDPSAVVALGGGAVAQPGLRAGLASRGRVVYLKASPERLLERVANDADTRPLLAGLTASERLEKLGALLEARRAAYESADLVVETDGASIENVAERILESDLAAGDPGQGESGGASLRVELGERSYPIRVGMDSLADAGAEIAHLTKATQVALVSVAPVARRYAARLARSLRDAGVRVHRFEVPDGDRTKNLRQVQRLYDGFIEKGLDRSSAVVSLGGGMVGDLAGFAAASYLRGIPFVQVPTSLLAMVDASVGGKVGVNLKQGKNLVGAFHQPRLVWIDAATLRSLPARERSAGMAEIIKAGALWDADFFARLEDCVEAALALEPAALLPVIERACAIKAEIVARDERESGVRRLLNLGHTLGHAVESLKRYREILHGEAVAMGMVFAARRSEELDLAPAGTADRLAALLERANLPTELPGFDRKAYLSALKVDKKKMDSRIHFVVLRRIGYAETVPLTPSEILPAGRASRARRR